MNDKAIKNKLIAAKQQTERKVDSDFTIKIKGKLDKDGKSSISVSCDGAIGNKEDLCFILAEVLKKEGYIATKLVI